MDNITLNIIDSDIKEANFFACKFADKEIKSRAFVNALGAKMTLNYLEQIGISAKNIFNVHYIRKILEEFDIADIMLSNIHIDVRVVFNENEIFIPKSHFEYDITPDIYIAVKIDKEFKQVEFLGFFEPDEIDLTKQNNEYYFIEKDKLSSMKDLRHYIDNCKNNTMEIIDASRIDEIRNLMFDTLDNDISHENKKELLKLLFASGSLRDNFIELENFETLSYSAVNEIGIDTQEDSGNIENIADLSLNDDGTFEEEPLTTLSQDINASVEEEALNENSESSGDLDINLAAGAAGIAGATAITGMTEAITGDTVEEIQESVMGQITNVLNDKDIDAVKFDDNSEAEQISFENLDDVEENAAQAVLNEADEIIENMQDLVEMPENLQEDDVLPIVETFENAEKIELPQIEPLDKNINEPIADIESEKVDLNSIDTETQNNSSEVVEESQEVLNLESFAFKNEDNTLPQESMQEDIQKDESTMLDTEFQEPKIAEQDIINKTIDEPLIEEIDIDNTYIPEEFSTEPQESKGFGNSLLNSLNEKAENDVVIEKIPAIDESFIADNSSDIPDIENNETVQKFEDNEKIIEFDDAFEDSDLMLDEIDDMMQNSEDDVFDLDDKLFVDNDDDFHFEDLDSPNYLEEKFNEEIIEPQELAEPDETILVDEIAEPEIDVEVESEPEPVVEPKVEFEQQEVTEPEEFVQPQNFSMDEFPIEAESLPESPEDTFLTEEFAEQSQVPDLSEFIEQPVEETPSEPFEQDVISQEESFGQNIDNPNQENSKEALNIFDGVEDSNPVQDDISDENVANISMLTADNFDDLDEIPFEESIGEEIKNDEDTSDEIIPSGAFASVQDFSHNEINMPPQNTNENIETLFEGEDINNIEESLESEDLASEINFEKSTPGAALNMSNNGSSLSKSVVTIVLGAIFLATACGIGFFLKNKSNSNSPADVPPLPISDDYTEENQNKALSSDIPDISQAAKQDAIEQAQNSDSNQKPKNDGEPLNVSNLVWQVPDYLSYSDEMKTYLTNAGKSIKLQLSSDLLLATEYAYSDKVKIFLKVSETGEVQESNVTISSGSQQIDNIVLQSVKSTLNAIKPPQKSLKAPDFNLTITISF